MVKTPLGGDPCQTDWAGKQRGGEARVPRMRDWSGGTVQMARFVFRGLTSLRMQCKLFVSGS